MAWKMNFGFAGGMLGLLRIDVLRDSVLYDLPLLLRVCNLRMRFAFHFVFRANAKVLYT